MFSKQTIEEVRARSDIVDVVGSHVELKRAGSSWKALCPFHKEKTPSFHVNPQRQIFHCFGCDAGGDVFRFTMDYEGVDFPTAIRLLADRGGMHIREEEGGPEPKGPPKDRIYRVLDQAATLYHRALKESDKAAAARTYLAKRQLEGEPLEQFRIGYAPDQRGAIQRWADKKEISSELLEAAGLLARGERGDWYERFRDRLMFPIQDEMGRVIGFSGRTLSDRRDIAKYINSPETPVFQKSRVFFAMDRARKPVAECRTAIICEGQIDAIRCHVAGLGNVVASQGTAMTENHARLIKRYADSLVLLLDADTAGQEAAIRSAEVFLGAGLNVRVAALPAGEDPDSLVLNQGADALRTIVDQARSIVEFQWRILEVREDLGDPAAHERAVQSVLHTVSSAATLVQQEELVREMRRVTYLRENRLLEDLRRNHRRRAPAQVVESRGEPAEAATAPPPRAEVELLAIMSRHHDVRELVHRYMLLDRFTDANCRRVAEQFIEEVTTKRETGEEQDPDTESQFQRLVARVHMQPEKSVGEDISPTLAAQDLILLLNRRALERERDEIRRRALDNPGAENPQHTQLCQQLSLDINALKQGWNHALPILEVGFH